MDDADAGIRASFKLHYRCHNCERAVFKRLDVPDVDDAPGDVEELLESAFLQLQRYLCGGCEGAISTLIAVTRWQAEEIAV